MKKLALYIHVPFCVQKCLYCDFLSMPASENVQEQYISALTGELEYWRGELEGQYELGSIFIGGGTPTVLKPELLLQIGEVLQGFSSVPGMEFTIEANPGTLTLEHIPAMQSIGVNRISLGLQSAQEQELQMLGRIHTYQDFVESYRLLQEHGFQNINIDLMSDIP
ncbi:MAG: radical SAM protein, partial [Lachnospiraceae bacterium]|nr:radical SAM protein [Lachnospiraceae bacterium]